MWCVASTRMSKLFSPNRVSALRGSYGKCKGRWWPVLDQGAPSVPPHSLNSRTEWPPWRVHAFRLRMLPQRLPRDFGRRSFSCKLSHKMALVTCPCAFRHTMKMPQAQSLRSRNAHGYLTRAIIMQEFTGKMPPPKVVGQTWRETAQSKCTWTCRKSQFNYIVSARIYNKKKTAAQSRGADLQAWAAAGPFMTISCEFLFGVLAWRSCPRSFTIPCAKIFWGS